MSTTALFDALNIGLVFSPYPLSDKDRQIFYEHIKPNETIEEYLNRIDLIVPAHMRDGLMVNGVRLPYNLWDKAKFKKASFITISSNVGATMMTAYIIIAIVTVALSVYVAVTNVPPAALSQKQGTDKTTSPTYSITGGSNTARPYEPMPLVFGTHRVYPDLSITPYTRIEGANQFLYQIFNFGVNELTISDIQIGDTDISQFNETTTEIAPFSTGKINLFPAATISAEGAQLDPSTDTNPEYTLRTSAANATALIIDMEFQLIRNDEQYGTFMQTEMRLIAEYRLVGDTTWLDFPTSGQKGIIIVSGSQFKVRNRGSKIARRTMYLKVDQGQYEVRMLRYATPLDSDSFSVRSANWIQLLSMQPDEADYSNRMRLGLRIRATSQLSGVVASLSAQVSNLIPVYDSSTGLETTQQSSNPADLYIWFLRGAFDSSGAKIFGAGLSDDDIDLDGLREWQVWCTENDLSFNAIIDTPQSVFETLQQISSAGRASPQLSLTQMSVVFDEENKLPIQAFGMGSIIKNSFKVTYLSDNIPTEIVVKYIDADRDYERREVTKEVFNLEEYGLEPNPIDVELFGVTNLSQAGRQANLIAASYVFRRRLIEFTVDIENLIAVRGDVILIGHDLTAWSDSGRLVGGVTFGDYTIITLDKEVTVGDESFITIRDPNINLTTHTVTSSTSPTNVITISPALDIAPDDNTNNLPKDYVWMFEDDSSPGLNAKISDIKTQDNLFATITCVEDNPEYYEAESEDYEFSNPFTYNDEVAIVSGILFSEELLSLSGMVELNISWTTSQSDSVDVTVSLNDGDYQTFSGVTTNSIDINVAGDDIVEVSILANSIVSLRASNLPATSTYQVIGLLALPQDVSSFNVARIEDTLSFTWSSVSDIDIRYYEIRRGDTWSASTLVAQVNANVLTTTDYSSGTFLLKAVDQGLRESENAITTAIGSSTVNIIFTQDQEDLSWAGTLDGLVINSSNALTLDVDTDGVYLSEGSYTTESIDIGAVNVDSRVEVSLTTSLNIPGYTWASLDLAWIEYYKNFWFGTGVPSEFLIYVSTSSDNVTFSDFELFAPGAYASRYFMFRLYIYKPESSDDIPIVSSMEINIDVQDVIVTFSRETVVATGSTFTFDTMNIIPNIQVSISGGTVGDVYEITNATTSSVTVQVFDSSGVAKAAVVNILVHGY